MQAFLVDVIRRWISSEWKFTHIPLGEYRDPITAGRLKRLGVVAGWPDLQFAGPNGRMVFLELKRKGGKLSEAQAAMKGHLEGCGFEYFCTDYADVAVEMLKRVGVLRSGFSVQ